MRSISNLSTALIIAAAIVLIGNILNCGLSDVVAANMGFAATSSLNVQSKLLYVFSGILFVLGVVSAFISIAMERKKNKKCL